MLILRQLNYLLYIFWYVGCQSYVLRILGVGLTRLALHYSLTY